MLIKGKNNKIQGVPRIGKKKNIGISSISIGTIRMLSSRLEKMMMVINLGSNSSTTWSIWSTIRMIVLYIYLKVLLKVIRIWPQFWKTIMSQSIFKTTCLSMRERKIDRLIVGKSSSDPGY